ncbi:hypothetical protein [Swingsia samuiensis]|uniref:Uncharacterized protein n=1 Tax=Swingsia samuiensis TaxID=1293412 RepID=A0A4Y6UIN3_9PROT|nr:hypothetical protein [Swingsia samuiensis]QDH17412.1 hypothetical protein E3D00_07415 [Swingsia samuiensis]
MAVINGIKSLLNRLRGKPQASANKTTFDAIAKRVMDKTKNLPYINAGFLEDGSMDGNVPVAAVAIWNEFGTPTIPERPFMRQTIEKNKAQWPKLFAAALTQAGGDFEAALDVVAERIVEQIQNEIKAFKEPPNAASTIKKKGFDNPLIDTGNMLRSVHYEIKDD